MIVYMVINKVNGKKYIGKLVNTKKNHYLGSGVALQAAIEKYGRDNFERVTLEECTDKAHLAEREQYWIRKYDALNSPEFYNMTNGGEGGDTTSTHPEKAKFYSKRVSDMHGPILQPPPGAVIGVVRNRYRVQHNDETFVGTIDECLVKLDMEYSMFFSYIKKKHTKSYKYKNIAIEKCSQVYYLVEGKKYLSFSEIRKDYKISDSMINYHMQNPRKDWWKIQQIL